MRTLSHREFGPLAVDPQRLEVCREARAAQWDVEYSNVFTNTLWICRNMSRQ